MQLRKELRKEFKPGNDHALQPMDVYFSAVSIFEKHNFECLGSYIGTNSDGFSPKEKGRVYQKYPGGRLYILYYPGKDNPKLPALDQPLKDIRNEADTVVEEKFGEIALKKAKKIFITSESNRYLGFSVAHYIYANYADNTLTTEDSIDRDYDESYLTNLFPNAKRIAIKNGWQNMLFDHWTCGHHVLEAIERDIQAQ